MTIVASALSRLIQEHCEQIAAATNSYREILPAPTRKIAEDVQELLLRSGDVRSFLVLNPNDDLLPNEQKRHLLPEAATSVRDGSLVFILVPGALSYLQESVRGSGSGTRGEALSDEWPWAPSSRAEFDFLNRFLEIWAEEAGLPNQAIPDAARVLRSAVAALAGSGRRHEILFDEILEITFTRDAVASDAIEALLYKAGMPSPTDKAILTDKSLTALLGEFDRSLPGIRREIENTGTRSLMNERITGVAAAHNLSEAALREASEHFLDGIYSRQDYCQGSMAVREGMSIGAEHWRMLTVEVLKGLFLKNTAKSDISVNWRPEGKYGSALFLDGTLHVARSSARPTVEARICTPVAPGTKIMFRLGRTLLAETLVDEFGKCEHQLAPLLSGKVSVSQKNGGQESKPVVLEIERTSDTEPLIVLAATPTNVNGDPEHVEYVYGTSEDMEEDDRVLMKIQNDSELHVFCEHPESTVSVDSMESPLATTAISDHQHIVQLSMESVAEADGRMDIDIKVSTFRASIALELSARKMGAPTLEDHLRTVLAAGSLAKIKAAIPACERIVASEPLLGAIDDGQRVRFALTRQAFECDGVSAGNPVSIDLRQRAPHSLRSGALHWVSTVDQDEVTASEVESLSGDGKRLLESYKAKRADVFRLIASSNENTSKAIRPIYAATLVSSAGGEEAALSSAIAGYLDAFVELSTFALKAEGLNYESRFALAFQDCLVPKHTAAAAFTWFIGPWHPIVLAKRYFVTRTLLNRAKDFTKNPRGRIFHGLTALVDRVAPLRWATSIAYDSSQPATYLVLATSDPGWLACTSAKNFSLAGAQADAAALGLDLEFGSVSAASSARRYIKDYMRAHPSRRSIVAYVGDGYEMSALVSEAKELLRHDSELTEEGKRLPGGIHLVGKQKFRPASNDTQWFTPPVCVYEQPTFSMESRVGAADLYLTSNSSPLEVAMTSLKSTDLASPRGTGDSVVHSLPIHVLDETRGHLSRSLSVERVDRGASGPEGVHASFVAALSTLESQSGDLAPCLSWELEEQTTLNTRWIVVPGETADPAVFVSWSDPQYASARSKLLWDYRLAVTRDVSSYYVVSQIPTEIYAALQGEEFLPDEQSVTDALFELSGVGIAIGGEAFKGRSKALGIVGLIGAVRTTRALVKPFVKRSGREVLDILLPVDAFQDLLVERNAEEEENAQPLDHRRADLLQIYLCLPNDEEEHMEIQFRAIESKYSGGVYPESKVADAIQQAQITFERAIALAEIGRTPGGVPERLALAKIVDFGLRIAGYHARDLQSRCLSRVLAGRYVAVAAHPRCMVVSSEAQLEKTTVSMINQDCWLRLAPESWPRSLTLSPSLQEMLGSLDFKAPGELQRASVVAEVLSSVGRPAADSGRVPEPLLDEKQDSESAKQAQPVRVLLGVSDHRAPVVFTPAEIENHNLMVTGSSGKGKTQLLKSLVVQLAQRGVPTLIVDFKNDYAPDARFLSLGGIKKQPIAEDGLPYNPLIPLPRIDEDSQRFVYHISQHISGLASAFRGAFQLGDQQINDVKNAIRTAFEEHGIATRGVIDHELVGKFPDFQDVGIILKETNKRAYARLDPLFDLDVFQDRYKSTPFSMLLGSGFVLDVSGVQDERVQNALAQIVVYSAHRYLNARPHSAVLNQAMLFDEAHRVLKTEFMERIVRECRAYGLGVFLSSQFPDDFPRATSANLATKIVHGNGPDSDRVSSIIRLLGLPEEDEHRIEKLGLFQAVVSNQALGNVYSSTLGYAHLLLLQALVAGATSRDNLQNVPGVAPGAADKILRDLIEMGLVKEIGSGMLEVTAGQDVPPGMGVAEP